MWKSAVMQKYAQMQEGKSEKDKMKYANAKRWDNAMQSLVLTATSFSNWFINILNFSPSL